MWQFARRHPWAPYTLVSIRSDWCFPLVMTWLINFCNFYYVNTQYYAHMTIFFVLYYSQSSKCRTRSCRPHMDSLLLAQAVGRALCPCLSHLSNPSHLSLLQHPNHRPYLPLPLPLVCMHVGMCHRVYTGALIQVHLHIYICARVCVCVSLFDCMYA